MQAIVLPVGADRYGIELTDVREVVPEPQLTPVPGAPSTVLGVVNLRGNVVPVLDTAGLLGLPPLDRIAFAVIAEFDAGLAGLAVDGEPATALLEEPAGQGRFALAGGIVTVLALDELVPAGGLAAT
jgi:purine-binding chemotaxis protein CheW